MDDIEGLYRKRTSIEKEMEALLNFLNSKECKKVGMTGALIDEEQYPRADVDIYAVREARHRVRCLENDLRSIESQLQSALEELHQKWQN
ncbi:hypothetical protein, conserved [Babesia bigemina]|uniref:Nas2 N-terminal domain-containing protein n=1 Tax=Babesia bigemina TaxID=5866 RepID=A0A061D8X9_BABBI|nr:hypothetical protein, conserved [Babesia bigemina]CDR95334.1 hypothetical protein, conserved [Babesia bigemina]|eukprot:XP_012767520.1 hypothetical protein, conserved [Babesia bigemina]